MAPGSGGAGQAAAAIGLALLFLLLVQTELVKSVEYYVGGDCGWTFNTESWPYGKNFCEGDVLVFNYTQGMHNVVPVHARNYEACTIPHEAEVFRTGNDRFRLFTGQYYFICSLPNHCEQGMKVAINVG